MKKVETAKKKAKKAAAAVVRYGAVIAVCFSPVWVTAFALGLLY